LSTEIRPKCEILIFKENERLKASLDTLPMSGGQKPGVLCLARRQRDDLAIADDLALPMKA
jgi:hypothetical protein